MTNRDKKVMVLICGAFLIILSFVLFFMFQEKNNMIDSGGRYDYIRLADKVCNDGEYVNDVGDCQTCEKGYYCPDKVHKYMCTGNTVALDTGMTSCVECRDIDSQFPYAYSKHTKCYACDFEHHYDESFTENSEYDIGYGVTHCASGAVFRCFYNSNTNDYKWSKEPPTSDYRVINSIDLEVNCGKVETDACYLNKETKIYYWGKYGNDNSYNIVISKDKDNCHKINEEVPKTFFSIEGIVLIAMIVLSLIGIGFITYSNYLGKRNK